jgi:hypothetical protein
VLHGSRAYGYPLAFKMSVDGAYRLEEILRLITGANQSSANGAEKQQLSVGHLSNLSLFCSMHDARMYASSNLINAIDGLFSYWR